MNALPLKLVGAWLVVSLPLAWGVLQSVEKASPLFLPEEEQPPKSSGDGGQD